MIEIHTDKPIEVEVRSLVGNSGCVCFMPSGSKLFFFDGTFIKVSPCSDLIYNRLKNIKK